LKLKRPTNHKANNLLAYFPRSQALKFFSLRAGSGSFKAQI